MRIAHALSFLLAVAPAACGNGSPLTIVHEDSTDMPVAGATAEDLDVFDRGDALFETVFRETQGLGPIYIQPTCRACHAHAARGPNGVTRMTLVQADGVTPAMDQSALPWGSTMRPQFTAGATRGVLPPTDVPNVRVSRRIGPSVFGRGWIEAIDEAEIVREEQRQAMPESNVSGRANRLADGRIGRFGWKARTATLDEFIAEAFLGDMGLTSPLLPDEVPNPDRLTDDQKPGIDLSEETVRLVAGYVRRLAMPRREGLTDAGRMLFEQVGCANCHTPTLHTRKDFPVAALADKDAPVYTDLLLHDMGTLLADGLTDGSATEREWRTPPLIGLRFYRNFMHDGRARTIEEAIAMHLGPGSEANAWATTFFEKLSDAERATLVDFVKRL